VICRRIGRSSPVWAVCEGCSAMLVIETSISFPFRNSGTADRTIFSYPCRLDHLKGESIAPALNFSATFLTWIEEAGRPETNSRPTPSGSSTMTPLSLDADDLPFHLGADLVWSPNLSTDYLHLACGEGDAALRHIKREDQPRRARPPSFTISARVARTFFVHERSGRCARGHPHPAPVPTRRRRSWFSGCGRSPCGAILRDTSHQRQTRGQAPSCLMPNESFLGILVEAQDHGHRPSVPWKTTWDGCLMCCVNSSRRCG